MDRVENYRRILQQVVKRHARFQPANGHIKTHAVCDVENDDYMVVDSGWNEKGRRINDVVFHFRLQDGIVHVERGDTDAEIVHELFNASVGTSDIILAYKALPYQKLSDLVMA